MRDNRTYHYRITKKISALLLMMLFLAIPIVQSWHSHHSVDAAKADTEKSIVNASEKCLICDYTAEIKGKQILSYTPIVLQIPSSACAELNFFVYTRIYQITLQGFTNKGPPSFNC